MSKFTIRRRLVKHLGWVVHSVAMLKNKKLVAALAFTVAASAWGLFRPELLFVNTVVHEKLPTSGSGKTEVEAKGSFVSQAHETTGTAELVKLGDKHFLRLSSFHTSNGPDVRVYITDGGKPGQQSVALGSLKGNIGDQFYELPGTYKPGPHDAVAIWCERFAVGFGKADLRAQASSAGLNRALPELRLAGFAGRTEVTFGAVQGDRRLSGKGTLVEENGKRFAEVRLSKFAPNFALRLVKKETLGTGAFPTAAFIDLRAPKAIGGKFVSITPLDQQVDFWLYRTIAIIDSKTQAVVGYVNLRSAQEKAKTLFFA